MTYEPDIENLLKSLSQERPEPSAALISRVLADADRVQSGFTKRENWWHKIKRHIPKLPDVPTLTFPAAGAMAASLVVGLFSLNTLETLKYDEIDQFTLSMVDYIEADVVETAETNAQINAWISGWHSDTLLGTE